ncbi:hypothetical protein SORBI_3009G219601 [Sorghum bicolor]|uniref:Uncharacterized protein n=1 Tax=Sorghum bicolor TaxID=4558 RepID=A0A1Z5R4M6_SORBI|nr:hypothetical protein SORBI_3009G219601 [Sorghum bicolor]
MIIDMHRALGSHWWMEENEEDPSGRDAGPAVAARRPLVLGSPSPSPCLCSFVSSRDRMNKPRSGKNGQGKRRRGGGGGLRRVLRDEMTRLRIIWRCVVLLLCYHD